MIREPSLAGAILERRRYSNAAGWFARRVIASLMFMQVLAVGCSARQPSRTPIAREYPGVLRDPSSIPGNFVVRQTVEAHHGQTTLRFDAVLQKNGNTLTLLGFTPFGTRAFLLRQIGVEVSFTQYLGRDLPFPPKYMLFDIGRALFIGLPGAPLSDGEHSATLDEEQMSETWAGGKLTQRRFRRVDGTPSGEIAIRYEGGALPPVPPSRMEFRNEWFGYELIIEVQSYRALE